MTTRRLGALGVLLALVSIGVACSVLRPPDGRAAARPASDEILVDLGDVVRVQGGDVGCRVTKRAEFQGRKVLDCRRAGALPGTFGALLGAQKLLVVRFESRRVARVVFRGSHEGASTRCG